MSRPLVLPLALCAASSLACLGDWDRGPNVGVAVRVDSWFQDTADTQEPELPSSVLLYSGNGGVGAEGFYDSMTHVETLTLLQAQGDVTRTDVWPTDLLDYRLILLSAPGLNAELPFTTGQISDLTRYLDAGGVLVIEAENESVMGYTVLNDLLEGLNLDLRLDGGFIGGDAQPSQVHALTLSVSVVGVLAGSRVSGTGCLLSLEADCVAATVDVGPGTVVLLGDGNILSNISTWQDQGYDNGLLLRRILDL